MRTVAREVVAAMAVTTVKRSPTKTRCVQRRTSAATTVGVSTGTAAEVAAMNAVFPTGDSKVSSRGDDDLNAEAVSNSDSALLQPKRKISLIWYEITK